MNNGINLLDYKSTQTKQARKFAPNWLRFSAVILLFIVSASSIIFFILIALSPLPDLEKKYKNASFTLTSMISDVVKLELVKERALEVEDINTSRKKYHMILRDFDEIRPADVSFERISINKENLNISFTSTSLASVDKYMTELTSSDFNNQLFSKVSLTKLQVDTNSNIFTAELEINVL